MVDFLHVASLTHLFPVTFPDHSVDYSLPHPWYVPPTLLSALFFLVVSIAPWPIASVSLLGLGLHKDKHFVFCSFL